MDHDPNDDEAEPYAVGYASPPLKTRWKKGQSGNASGRPRGSKSRGAILTKVAFEQRVYKQGAKERRGPTIELVFLAIRNAAANGNHKALALLNKFAGYLEPEDTPVQKMVFITGEKLTEEEWDAKYGHLAHRAATPES